MVNYNYLLDHIEENNEHYLANGIVTVSETEDGAEDGEAWLRERVGQNVRLIDT